MADSQFKRVVEDFVCEHCGFEVKGSGYTNHCPKCLWSKHVDVFPGDREEVCKGLMKPIRSEQIEGDWYVIQKCEKCSREWKNRLVEGDNFDVLVELSKEQY